MLRDQFWAELGEVPFYGTRRHSTWAPYFTRGIEVDKAKIEVIEKLPPLSSVRGIRSFLSHTGFYRRFIEDFSRIEKPLSSLLVQETPFDFDEQCVQAFSILKDRLV